MKEERRLQPGWLERQFRERDEDQRWERLFMWLRKNYTRKQVRKALRSVR